MTPVRGKRGRFIHVTHDARTTMCGRKCDSWIIEPDAKVTCPQCEEATTTN